MPYLADSQRIVQQLKQFGCTQTEAQIYMTALVLGPASVLAIANKLKINRVTCHSAIEQLIKMGFLFESRKGERRLIVAENPDILQKFLEKKYNEIQLIEGNLDHVMKALESMKNVDKSVPTVRMYDGSKGFKKMLEETLEAKNGVRVFSYVDIFSKIVGPDWLESFFVRRAAKNVHSKLIFPPCDFASRVAKKSQQYKIEIRLSPPEIKWKSGFFQWNDCVAWLSYTENRTTCTIIQNPDIAFFVRNIIFEFLWKDVAPYHGV